MAFEHQRTKGATAARHSYIGPCTHRRIDAAPVEIDGAGKKLAEIHENREKSERRRRMRKSNRKGPFAVRTRSKVKEDRESQRFSISRGPV